jgi:hypothetical protein
MRGVDRGCWKISPRTRGVYLILCVVLDLFFGFILAWMVLVQGAQRYGSAAHGRSYRPAAATGTSLTIDQDRDAPDDRASLH